VSSYIDTPPCPVDGWQGFDWRLHTYSRLEWLYGPERAYRIHRGADPETQLDVERWNRLGTRDAA